MHAKLRTRGRGANVPHAKSTMNLPTVTMTLPSKIVLPMQQHIGAPCLPVVEKGQAVSVGTLVGKANGFISADIHSGVSGIVESVGKIMSPGGDMVDAVTIIPDGQQNFDLSLVPPSVRDKESFLAAVRACGLVGLGGAGFPTAVKLSPKNPDTINLLIINAAECEPYITADNREMLENADYVMSGITAIKTWLDIPKVVIAIERNKPEAIDLMLSLTEGLEEVFVMPMPSHYPQGAEKVLIEKVCGRQVPTGGLPADVGVIVLNVSTAGAIGSFLSGGLPLTTRRLTVDGPAIVEPKNVEVIIGTPIQEVIDYCGGFKAPAAKILMGGPMMGVAMADTSYPVQKQNNAIVALTAEAAKIPPESPCIRCGRCVLSCPVRLSPVEICEAYERKNIEALGKLHAEVCMSCGVCSFVCPAKRMLSPTTTLARILCAKEAKK